MKNEKIEDYETELYNDGFMSIAWDYGHDYDVYFNLSEWNLVDIKTIETRDIEHAKEIAEGIAKKNNDIINNR